MDLNNSIRTDDPWWYLGTKLVDCGMVCTCPILGLRGKSSFPWDLEIGAIWMISPLLAPWEASQGGSQWREEGSRKVRKEGGRNRGREGGTHLLSTHSLPDIAFGILIYAIPLNL